MQTQNIWFDEWVLYKDYTEEICDNEDSSSVVTFVQVYNTDAV